VFRSVRTIQRCKGLRLLRGVEGGVWRTLRVGGHEYEPFAADWSGPLSAELLGEMFLSLTNKLRKIVNV